MKLVTIRKDENGFTLIELMVTLFVAAVIAGIAIPSFQNLIEENRLTGQTNNLVSAFKLARSEAVTGAVPVTLAATDGDFANGWCVYQGQVGDACDDDSRIRQFSASSQVDWADEGDTAFQFDDRGRRTDPGPGDDNVSIMIRPQDCESGANRQRTVTVSSGGRAAASREDCP